MSHQATATSADAGTTGEETGSTAKGEDPWDEVEQTIGDGAPQDDALYLVADSHIAVFEFTIAQRSSIASRLRSKFDSLPETQARAEPLSTPDDRFEEVLAGIRSL